MANKALLTLRPGGIGQSVNGNTHNMRLFENPALRGRAYCPDRSEHQRIGAQKTQCVWSLDMKKFLAKFAKDESGATAIEYGLIAAGIAVVIVAAVGTVGDNLVTMFDNIAADLL
jgi:pilus assembly protein Flp/PilA